MIFFFTALFDLLMRGTLCLSGLVHPNLFVGLSFFLAVFTAIESQLIRLGAPRKRFPRLPNHELVVAAPLMAHAVCV